MKNTYLLNFYFIFHHFGTNTQSGSGITINISLNIKTLQKQDRFDFEI